MLYPFLAFLQTCNFLSKRAIRRHVGTVLSYVECENMHCQQFWLKFPSLHIYITHNFRAWCTVRLKKKETPLLFPVQIIVEMKLFSINIYYRLLQFEAFFFIGVLFPGGSLPNLNFYNVNSQIWQRNCKVHPSNSLDKNFQNISDINLRVIRRRNYN